MDWIGLAASGATSVLPWYLQAQATAWHVWLLVAPNHGGGRRRTSCVCNDDLSVFLLCACSCALAVVVQRVFVCAACAVVRWLLEGNRSDGAAARSAGGGQAERVSAHTEDRLIINGGRPASGVAAVAAGAGCLRHAAAVVRQGSSLPNWVRRLGTKLFHSLWLLSATKLSLTKPTHAHATARASLSLSLCLPSAHFPSEKNSPHRKKS